MREIRPEASKTDASSVRVMPPTKGSQARASVCQKSETVRARPELAWYVWMAGEARARGN